MDKHTILLKDSRGEKILSGMLGRKRSSVAVLRGELLAPIPGDEISERSDGKKPHNYRLKRDPTHSLYCHDHGDNTAPLSDYDVLLLEGITSRIARYEVYTSANLLQWGSTLKNGNRVNVTLPSLATIPAAAIVRYVGVLATQPGMYFGVEIMDEQYRGRGTTDGTYRGHKYFVCEDKCGLFVALDKLSPVLEGNTVAKAPPSVQSYGTPAKASPLHSPPPADSTWSRGSHLVPIQQPSQHPLPVQRATKYPDRSHSAAPQSSPQPIPSHAGLGVGSTVQMSDPPRYGVIKWMGGLPNIQGLVAGVELDDYMDGCTDGTWQGKRYFTCPYGRGFFCPPYTLRPDQRFSTCTSETTPGATPAAADPLVGYPLEKQVDQTVMPDQTGKQPGDERAMKGQASPHHNHSPQHVTAQQGHVQTQHDKFSLGSTVQISDTPQYGVIRWIGELPYVQGLIAGVELDEYMDGCADGTHQGRQYFTCPYGRGFFCPYKDLRPDQRFGPTGAVNPLAKYPLGKQVDQTVMPDQTGKQPGDERAIKGQVSPQHVPAQQSHVQTQHGKFGLGSTVQISDTPQYGVIRWIGELPYVQGLIAGIELDEYMDGCADGTHQGRQYFTCPYGRGFFCPYKNLRPDQRFGPTGAVNPLAKFPLEERSDQTVMSNQMEKYLGDERGIQGYQNSCYLDSTVFGLFALSDVFDSIFLEEAQDAAGKEISSILWKGIVNPLRKNGVVRFESVMQLRNKLEELGKMKGINQDEKDPEEFLNMLFKHMLHVEPFISIRRPFGTEQEYFVQLFLEYDDSMKLPTVGDLLTKMFKEQKISFTEPPSKLLIQVPRFGKQFKTYQKIMPDLNLDVMELTDSPNPCFICGKSAQRWCAECMTEVQQFENPVYFCLGCSESIHGRPHRIGHKVEMAQARLELLSVICIETSHYVCFTRAENRWIFFDSMANRALDMYNIPKGVDCTQELNEWVYSGDLQQLLDTPPRVLPEYVRRFTQDIYMCVYISPDAGMYGGTPTLAGYRPVSKVKVHPESTQLKKEKAHMLQAQHEKQELQERQTDLEQQLQKEQRDTQQHLQQLEQQMREERQQMREEIQRIQEEKRQLERQLQEQIAENLNLHQQVIDAQSEARKTWLIQPQSTIEDIEHWKVSRNDVQVVKEIGVGAWGSVSEGNYRGQLVAVKQPHRAILTPLIVERLHREVKIMAQVRHPNLVRFIAAVFDDEVQRLNEPPLIVLELLDMNLRTAYERDVVGASQVPIFRDVAYGLHYLHEHQDPIIHRDISSPNILLEALPQGAWRAKVSDFGSANLEKHSKTAGEGAIIYSAPETFPHTDPTTLPPLQTTKIDVFSYGILLCEVITKQLPENSTKYRHMLQQVQTQWLYMYDLIISCTKHDPNERSTMAHVLDKLNKLPRPRFRQRS